MKTMYDAVVIGSGPNGYAAAIYLAEKNYSVLLIEGRELIGGGMRTAELTQPGFHHDVCSTLHPLAAGSPFFSRLPLEEHGLKWIHPPVYLAHPLDDGSAGALFKSVEDTAEHLGEDKETYIKLMKPLSEDWNVIADLLGPLRIPNDPLPAIRFGLYAMRSSNGFIKRFNTPQAKALFTGLAAHGVVPTNKIFTSAIGLVLGIAAHVNGWPYADGGSVKLAEALDSYFRSIGGEVIKDMFIEDYSQIPETRTILFGTSPKAMIKVMGDRFSDSYIKALNKFKYGPAAYKIDFAVSEPVPFTNELCRRSGFVHIGGTHNDIIAAEKNVFENINIAKPFVLFAQPTLFDKTRSPEGKHIAYAYCHVPNGSNVNMDEQIISQIERFAPGFRDTIISYSSMKPMEFETYNPNYVGGDINGGMATWNQLFTRPVKRLNPYKTSAEGVFICSSSTPPGGGVHGLCGYYGALSAEEYLKNEVR
jgi:phytoene dehydrogenase-like protein